MARLLIEIPPEKIAELLRDLLPEDLKKILRKIADRLESQEWMSLAEAGFRDWLTEPDLYGDDGPAR